MCLIGICVEKRESERNNENVLRKAKQLEKDRILGLSNVSDPIVSIAELKYKLEFAGC